VTKEKTGCLYARRGLLGDERTSREAFSKFSEQLAIGSTWGSAVGEEKEVTTNEGLSGKSIRGQEKESRLWRDVQSIENKRGILGGGGSYPVAHFVALGKLRTTGGLSGEKAAVWGVGERQVIRWESL